MINGRYLHINFLYTGKLLEIWIFASFGLSQPTKKVPSISIGLLINNLAQLQDLLIFDRFFFQPKQPLNALAKLKGSSAFRSY